MNGMVAIIGLVLLSVGIGLYSWPAGLIALGAGLYLDSILPRRSAK